MDPADNSSVDLEYTVEGARRAAERDDLETWVRRFLASEGSDNAVLAEQLTSTQRWWTGPVQLPISSLHRLAGPADEPVLCPVDDVAEMADKIDGDDWDPPPVVVMYRDDHLVLEDGNHRVESLRRAGETEAWSVVGFESAAARERFGVRPGVSTT